jgi:hypothetical protein
VISLIIRNSLNSVSAKTTQINDKTIINVENLFSIFVLYSLAIGFSIIVQIIEILYKKPALNKLIKTSTEFNLKTFN